MADLFLSPPLSMIDIENLEELSNKFSFNYTAIIDKKEINKKNRNSKIEIVLNK